MRRNTITKVAAIAVALSMAAGSTVLAAANPKPDNANLQNKTKVENKCEHKGMRRYGGIIEKLGLTKQELIDAQKSGKTLFDLAKTKGYTADQVKEMIIKGKTDAINRAIADGKLSKTEGDMMIAKVKEKISKWDGKIKVRDN